MIDIPIGKALIAVEQTTDDEKGTCDGCVFWDEACHGVLACMHGDRQDGKDVKFQIVDYKEQP